jgi:DNA-directed RNA polymerase specialized sigma24 family protein
MDPLIHIVDGDEDPTDLNRLLLRLDPVSANAWEKYRGLRDRLVKFFEWNHCTFPQELADEVLDRVARKPPNDEIRNVAEFVIGIARNVRLEAYKRNQREVHVEARVGGLESLPESRDREEEIVAEMDRESNLNTLNQCLRKLKACDRALALDYYSASDEKQKIHRRNLAVAAGITIIALRVRANRLREKLEKCMRNGLDARQRKRDP